MENHGATFEKYASSHRDCVRLSLLAPGVDLSGGRGTLNGSVAGPSSFEVEIRHDYIHHLKIILISKLRQLYQKFTALLLIYYGFLVSPYIVVGSTYQ